MKVSRKQFFLYIEEDACFDRKTYGKKIAKDYDSGKKKSVGVKAKVELTIPPKDNKISILHAVITPGTWNVLIDYPMSEEDKTKVQKIFEKESGVLEHMLKHMGFELED